MPPPTPPRGRKVFVQALLIGQAIMDRLFLGPSLQKRNPPSPIAPFQLLGRHNVLVFSRNGGFQALGFDFTGQAFFRRVPQAILGHGKHLTQITKAWRVVALHGTAPLLLTYPKTCAAQCH